MSLRNHPTVIDYHRQQNGTEKTNQPLAAAWLRELCLAAGADDVGFVEIDRPALADQQEDIRQALPGTLTLISYVCRMNRGPIRSPARSVANLEFHHTGDEVNEVGRHIVRQLEAAGVSALNPSMGFPMEMDKFPGKIWVVSHKPVAEAAGMGRMGIHRNIIHPKFGNFILLGTILVAAEVDQYDRPINYNPCLECKLCVAACPVGAIHADGHFDFSACYTHNYREFMSGFTNWAEQVAESKSKADYTDRVSDTESASMWQSLSFGANYKAAYCLSVCPAGEDVIGPFLDSRKEFLGAVVKPLQEKEEDIYVRPHSDAENHVRKRFPHKRVRRIGNSLRVRSIEGFLSGLPLTFQRRQSKGLDLTYHFTFVNGEETMATVTVRDQQVVVEQGHQGKADLRLTADSQTWVRFLNGRANLVWALVTRKFKLKGSPKHLVTFGKLFG